MAAKSLRCSLVAAPAMAWFDRPGVSGIAVVLSLLAGRLVVEIQHVVEVVNQSAGASEEHANASNDRPRSVKTISTVLVEAALGIAQISQHTSQLRRAADTLWQRVERFTMEHHQGHHAIALRPDRVPKPSTAALSPSGNA